MHVSVHQLLPRALPNHPPPNQIVQLTLALSLSTFIDLRFIDKNFPATSSSVNNHHPEGKYYAWMRAYELAVSKGLEKGDSLFVRGVSASDLSQGGLGDCWLIAAIAALAEYPGLIHRIFITKETNPFGRYQLRLFDISANKETKGKFVDVIVDDRLPCECDGGYPRLMYLKMDDSGEIWPLLLEKALAKWSGSYENLDGGFPAWALATLTGWETESYRGGDEDGTQWEKYNIIPDKEQPRNPHKIDVNFSYPRVKFGNDEFFAMLKEFDQKDFIMTCATGSGRDTEEDSSQGIVKGHAYTLRGVHEVGEHKILQLRNPWGKFEWTGKWSDKHSSWLDHPEVMKELNPSWGDDGMFYIGWEDFRKNYTRVDVCKRDVGVYTDLYLNVDEEDGCVGPLKACSVGCANYLLGSGCRLTCGKNVNADDARKKWYYRSIRWLMSDFQRIKETRKKVNEEEKTLESDQ